MEESKLNKIENLYGETFELYDDAKSMTLPMVLEEFKCTTNKMFMHSLEVKPPEIVVDIGAHVGIFSCLMAKKFPKAEIHSVEAVKDTFQNLLKSLEHNKLTNVEPLNYAIWHNQELTKLLMDERNTGSASMGNYSHCKEVAIGECINLNELFKLLSLDKAKEKVLVKMDIERAEYAILPDFKYWDAIDRLLIEVHYKSLPPQGIDVAESLNLLSFIQQRLSNYKIFATLPFELSFHAGAYLPVF